MALISVVLPAPLGPSRPKNAPAGNGQVEALDGKRAVVIALGQTAGFERWSVVPEHPGEAS